MPSSSSGIGPSLKVSIIAALVPLGCSPAGRDYQSCLQHHGARAKTELAVGMANTACGNLHRETASPGEREWARCVLARIDQPGTRSAAALLYRDCQDTPTQRAEGEEAERRRREAQAECDARPRVQDPSVPPGFRRRYVCPPPSSRFDAVMDRLQD